MANILNFKGLSDTDYDDDVFDSDSELNYNAGSKSKRKWGKRSSGSPVTEPNTYNDEVDDVPAVSAAAAAGAFSGTTGGYAGATGASGGYSGAAGGSGGYSGAAGGYAGASGVRTGGTTGGYAGATGGYAGATGASGGYSGAAGGSGRYSGAAGGSGGYSGAVGGYAGASGVRTGGTAGGFGGGSRSGAVSASGLSRACVVKPNAVTDALNAVDLMEQGCHVIVVAPSSSDDERILDVLSGAAFIFDSEVLHVEGNVYYCRPKSATVSGLDKASNTDGCSAYMPSIPDIAPGKENRVLISRPREMADLSEVMYWMKKQVEVQIYLENSAESFARRVLDVLAGAAYACKGDVFSSGASRYICRPEKTEITEIPVTEPKVDEEPADSASGEVGTP